MPQKALVIGGATLDVIIAYEEMETLIHQRKGFTQSYLLLEEGKKIEVVEQKNASGGGATNAAVSFKRQGYDVALFCKLGKDFAGESVLKELTGYGLDTTSILFDEEIGTATSFVVPSLKGDRTVFAYRGANAHLLGKDLPLPHIKHSAFVYITSLSKASAAHLPELVKEARKQNVKVAVNPGVSQLKRGGGYLKSSLYGIDTLILNEEEAKTFMSSILEEEGLPTPEGEHTDALEKLTRKDRRFSSGYFNLREFFRRVLDLGPKVVVVTNGSEGVYVATQEHLYFHPALKIKVVNTLGAGDAFGSGFTGMWYRTGDLERAIRAGVLNSASVISYSDAKTGLLSEKDLEAQLAKGHKSDLTRMNW